MHHSRTSRGLLVAVCLVATLFATGSAVAGTGHAVRASDVAAPGGRLIVFWKPGHRTDVADARIASASIVRGHAAKHSLIVARPGPAGTLAADLAGRSRCRGGRPGLAHARRCLADVRRSE